MRPSNRSKTSSEKKKGESVAQRERALLSFIRRHRQCSLADLWQAEWDSPPEMRRVSRAGDALDAPAMRIVRDERQFAHRHRLRNQQVKLVNQNKKRYYTNKGVVIYRAIRFKQSTHASCGMFGARKRSRSLL